MGKVNAEPIMGRLAISQHSSVIFRLDKRVSIPRSDLLVNAAESLPPVAPSLNMGPGQPECTHCPPLGCVAIEIVMYINFPLFAGHHSLPLHPKGGGGG